MSILPPIAPEERTSLDVANVAKGLMQSGKANSIFMRGLGLLQRQGPSDNLAAK
jgi:hypothetical protein